MTEVAAQTMLQFMESRVNPLAQIWPWTWESRIWFHAIRPSGAILIVVPVLLWEASSAGYGRSSLKRLLAPSPSVKVDLFYLFTYVSNLKTIFGVLFSLGLGQLLYFWLNQRFSFALLSGQSFLLSLFVLTIVNTFLLYWIHRILHMGLFWPIHKVHHSATELIMITNFRNHPLTLLIEMTFYGVSAALLGVRSEVEVSYLILNGVYQLWAHSVIDWNLRSKRLGFIQDWVLLASEEHRLHHSKDPAHWNRNFGSVPLWDKLFGTWLDSRGISSYRVGLDDENDQDMLGSMRGFFVIMKRFLRL